jgi:hypothetical protein
MSGRISSTPPRCGAGRETGCAAGEHSKPHNPPQALPSSSGRQAPPRPPIRPPCYCLCDPPRRRPPFFFLSFFPAAAGASGLGASGLGPSSSARMASSSASPSSCSWAAFFPLFFSFLAASFFPSFLAARHSERVRRCRWHRPPPAHGPALVARQHRRQAGQQAGQQGASRQASRGPAGGQQAGKRGHGGYCSLAAHPQAPAPAPLPPPPPPPRPRRRLLAEHQCRWPPALPSSCPFSWAWAPPPLRPLQPNTSGRRSHFRVGAPPWRRDCGQAAGEERMQRRRERKSAGSEVHKKEG